MSSVAKTTAKTTIQAKKGGRLRKISAAKTGRGAAKQTIRKVGLIGLGKMGLPMARHLAAKGFTVTGFDVNPAAIAKARAIGAKTVKSPAQVAAASDLVIIIVGFDAEVDRALFGPMGIMAGAKPGLTVAIASTISPSYMRDLPERAARVKGRKKVMFVDAPLCRGEPAAEAGELLLLGGGDKAVFERCRPAFETFATSIHYLGGLGAGQVGKMVNNLILWACISANDEGLKLARTLGVEQEPLRQALLQSSARNWALEMHNVDLPMPWAEKDMSLVLHEADEARVSLPLCGVIKEVIKSIKVERGQPYPRVRKD
jgi:3-hydroxyisobutyrate dehydrogenase-like beta-hydroxyacid dehydrogenase